MLVEAGRHQLAEAITTNRHLVADLAVPAIFEATFEADDVHVRVDIFERTGADAFRILEVKSSTELKDECRYDIGIQKQVVRRSVLQVSVGMRI